MINSLVNGIVVFISLLQLFKPNEAEANIQMLKWIGINTMLNVVTHNEIIHLAILIANESVFHV